MNRLNKTEIYIKFSNLSLEYYNNLTDQYIAKYTNDNAQKLIPPKHLNLPMLIIKKLDPLRKHVYKYDTFFSIFAKNNP